MIIPGHGRIADQADMVEYRDMLTIVRDRVQDSIKKGLTLAQVKAARPTLDYDGRYGSPDAFIEAVYRDLSARRCPDAGIHHEGHHGQNGTATWRLRFDESSGARHATTSLAFGR